MFQFVYTKVSDICDSKVTGLYYFLFKGSFLEIGRKQVSFRGVEYSKCRKFGKMSGKDPQVCLFIGPSCPFLVIPCTYPYFLE